MLITRWWATRRGGGIRSAERATPEMVETLENGLRNYARVLHALTGRDMSQIPGGGAAGGMGIAAIVFPKRK